MILNRTTVQEAFVEVSIHSSSVQGNFKTVIEIRNEFANNMLLLRVVVIEINLLYIIFFVGIY